MIKKTFSDEFKTDGAEVVREKVAMRAYGEDEKHGAAIKWLNRQDPARKTYKLVKKQLELTRRTVRQTRLNFVISALTLIVLLLALAKIFYG
jgi:hypothetical protein